MYGSTFESTFVLSYESTEVLPYFASTEDTGVLLPYFRIILPYVYFIQYILQGLQLAEVMEDTLLYTYVVHVLYNKEK